MGARPELSLVQSSTVDPDTVAAVRQLLELVESGEIQSVAYIALHKGTRYSGDVTGAALTKPIFALGLVRILEEKLNQLVR